MSSPLQPKGERNKVFTHTKVACQLKSLETGETLIAVTGSFPAFVQHKNQFFLPHDPSPTEFPETRRLSANHSTLLVRLGASTMGKRSFNDHTTTLFFFWERKKKERKKSTRQTNPHKLVRNSAVKFRINPGHARKDWMR